MEMILIYLFAKTEKVEGLVVCFHIVTARTANKIVKKKQATGRRIAYGKSANPFIVISLKLEI